MRLIRLCICLFVAVSAWSSEPEPTVNYIAAWTNNPGTTEGTITARPVNTTSPAPPLGYMEYLPKGYNPNDPTTLWPIVMFISGAGEEGNGTNAAPGYQLYTNMTRHGPFYQMLTYGWDFPAIVVAVQQPALWDNATILLPEFEYMKKAYHIDTNRMYLTGLCDGAVGVLNFAAQHPGYLAGIMPIEEGANPNTNEAAGIKNTPMWTVHCWNDPIAARPCTVAWVDQSQQADTGTSNCMALYPGYAGKNYHEDAPADVVTGNPIYPFGAITSVGNCTLTQGSTWVAFGNGTTFGSDLFNTWGGTDTAPYFQLTMGSSPTPNSWAKAGLMMRDTVLPATNPASTSSGSMQVTMCMVPNNQVSMQWRSATGGGSADSPGDPNGTTDSVKYLKLTRVGNTYSGYYGTDGINYTLLNTVTVNFAGTTTLVGTEVCSHDAGNSYTQTFSNLSIDGVTPTASTLSDADIGSPSIAGSASLSGGVWTQTGCGADIWNNSDQFNFNSKSVTGDQTLIVKVGNNAPPYVVSLGKTNGVYLTHAWTGATTTTQTINICVPQGSNDTAYFNPSTSTWNWQPGQNWDTTQLCKRIFTMDWFQDHTAGWQITYNTANCWNWLFSQSLNPVITSQPQSVTITDGQSATFSVAALGTPNLTYQWTVNNVPVSGATGTVYTTAIPFAQSGEQIGVIVGSPSGTTTSLPAIVTVTPIAPVITIQPQSISVPSGSTATFSVSAIGSAPLTYQWSVGGVPIAGATSATYTTAPLVIGASGEVFSVMVSNAGGSVPSNGQAVLTVTPGAPVITTPPQSLTVNAGQTATFTVVASGVNLTYQWYLNTVLIGGATGTSYTTAAATSANNGDSYTVVVNNGGGTVTSPAAILTVTNNSILPTDFGDHQVIQRTVGTTAGLVTVTGTYTGTPDHIQAQVDSFGLGAVVVPWTTITTVPSGGTFSGTLTVPQGGWYQILVQSCNALGTVLASGSGVVKWGVGVDILCIGQSNMVGFGDTVYTTADDSVGLLYGGTTWMHMADPWISGGKASCGPALGNTISEALNLPVGLLPSAAGTNYIVPPPNSSGANVYSYRNPANPSDPTTIYGQALAAVQTAGGCEFVVISQGANEAENAGNWPSPVSAATYQADFQQMVSNFQGDLPSGSQVKFVFSQLGRKLDGGVLDAGYDNIRAAHRLLDNGTTQLLAGSTMDFPIVDGISHYGGVSQATHGRRLGRTVLHTLGKTSTYGGPRLGTAQFLDGTYTDIRVAISHRGGTDFAPTSSIIGFVVTDANGPHTVTGTRIDGQTIDLVGTAPFVGTTTFTYLEGKNPAGPLGLIADNQADPMPLLTETEPLPVNPPVLVAPTITTQPSSLTVAPGAAATFTVVASGSIPLTYQWSRGGTPISGATSASYTVASAALSDSGASFTVVVTNGAGSTPPSTPAILTVLVPSEPTLAINGWTNIPGQLEGLITTYPINTTVPAPPYGYVAYTPLGYNSSNTTVKWPVIIYLPNTTEAGDGTNTTANGNQLYNNMIKYGPLAQVVGQNWDFPAIIICPQVTTNWAKASNIKNVVTYVEAHYQVDTSRIFMTGDLEGASGALRYAVAYPTDLAGILTIEANTAVTTAQATTMKGLPMWAVHSFADLTCARAISINWMDGLSVANFGGTSDSMSTYPGFNGDRNHFATDVTAGNVPVNPNGDSVVIPGATLTHGSKSVAFPAGYTYGSGIFYLWCTSNGANFAHAMISGDPTIYNSTQGFANALTLGSAYVGTASPATLTIQTPVGYTNTGYRSSTGSWGWNRNEVWDQTHPDTLELTLYPNLSPTAGWVQTWANVSCWDWLLSWVKPPPGAGG